MKLNRPADVRCSQRYSAHRRRLAEPVNGIRARDCSQFAGPSHAAGLCESEVSLACVPSACALSLCHHSRAGPLEDLSDQASDAACMQVVMRPILEAESRNRLLAVLDCGLHMLTAVSTQAPNRDTGLISLAQIVSLTVTEPLSQSAFVATVCPVRSTSYKAHILELLQRVASFPPSHQRDAWTAHIQPALSSICADTTINLAAVARLWIALGRYLVVLAVPDIPIDPATEAAVNRSMSEKRSASLQQEWNVWYNAEIAVTGNTTSLGLIGIQQDLAETKRTEPKVSAIPTRKAAHFAAINDLHAEVQNFLDTIFSESAIGSMVTELATLQNKSAARADGFQQACAAFLTRLATRYQDLSDLAYPIQIAVRSGQAGVSLLSFSSAQRGNRALAKAQALAETLTSFPSWRSAEALLERTHAATIATSEPKDLILSLGAASYLARRRHISDVYERLSDLALFEDERKARLQQEAESLYRQRQVEETAENDVELDARELAEMFPDYDNEDLVAARVVSPSADDHQTIREVDLQQAYQLHCFIFAKDGQRSEDDAIDFFSHLRDEHLANILGRFGDLLGPELDANSTIYLANKLHVAQKSMGTGGSCNTNFYTAENRGQAQIALALLKKLHARLQEIQREWPDQMVLQHLLDRCDNIKHMSSASPIARFLPAFEQLLVHTEDWEQYANKENSIANLRGAITDLIISWRRLELRYWATLLEQNVKDFEMTVASWWIKLYRLLISSPRSLHLDGETAAFDKHLSDTSVLLAEFLTASQLGHFGPRMRLLKSFAEYVRQLCAEQVDLVPVWQRVLRLLQSLLAQYQQFEPAVAADFDRRRDIIGNEIRAFVKLASWKDINIQALRASAKKTHGQLFRTVRKLRELLKEPVKLLPVDINTSSDGYAAGEIRFSLPAIDKDQMNSANELRLHQGSVSAPLQELASTANRWQTVMLRSGGLAIAEQSDSMQDTCTTIIETVQHLRSETPSILTAENKKLVKSLEARKRKGFSEMLKAIKGMGFSSKRSATQRQRQESLLWIHQLQELQAYAPSQVEVDSINHYHNKLYAKMADMRASLAAHSDAIPTPDLERAHGFVENVYYEAIVQRER